MLTGGLINGGFSVMRKRMNVSSGQKETAVITEIMK